MKRSGLVCDSQTLWDQLDGLAKLLEPSYLALREYIIGADVIGADETWVAAHAKEGEQEVVRLGADHTRCVLVQTGRQPLGSARI